MIKATPKFIRLASKWMTVDALQALVDELILFPDRGVIITGTGGIRKIRWPSGKNNKGKRSGVRILYYYQYKELVLLITLFRKSDRENIDDNEKATLKKLLPYLIRSATHV